MIGEVLTIKDAAITCLTGILFLAHGWLFNALCVVAVSVAESRRSPVLGVSKELDAVGKVHGDTAKK